jgi:hypothetical protein
MTGICPGCPGKGKTIVTSVAVVFLFAANSKKLKEITDGT